MFNNDQRISQITQTLQGFQKLIVISLVQADRRLVQNIQYTHKRRANLRCQTNALALTAGQRRRSTGQGQVLQAHIHQKTQSCLNLTDNGGGNNGHIPLQLEVIHKRKSLGNAHTAEIHNANATNCHRTGNFRKPIAVAAGTGRSGHTFLQLLAGRIRLGLPKTTADVIEDSLKGLLQHAHTVSAVIGHFQFLTLCAVENHIHSLPRQLLHRYCQGKMVFLRQCLEIHSEDGICPRIAPAGGLNRAVKDRLGLIGNY